MDTINDDVDYCPSNFHEMEIDDRILKAIAKLGWFQPTLIQERAIPLLLEGKDVLVRARTGSGKTGAFGIPLIQKILNSKHNKRDDAVRALVMAPSRELCRQIYNHFLQLSIKCSKDVRIVDISPHVDVSAQRPLLAEMPDIVIATPARALVHLKAGTISLTQSLEMLVVDEADLVFSFGHEDDVKQVVKYLPRVYQACLASATLTDEVLSLKKLVLRNAVTLKLEEPHLAPVTQLSHYFLYAEEEDKATILYTLIKLNLMRGKSIVFTNTVDKSYKLKLYLEQFAIKTCVLNSELPASVRCHSVAQFNDGIYNIIIASDEMALETASKNCENQPKKNKSNRKKDKESGVARGIDFQFVSNVINFDFPLAINSYIHRAGRTARGTNQGTALSFVSVREKEMMEKVDKYLQDGLSQSEPIFKLYEMKMEDIEGFRYRSRDAWRATTRIAVREARLKEIKHEILNSSKLKGYFEENPRELKTLRHDKFLHTVKVYSHMSDVPDYLLPSGLKRNLQQSLEDKQEININSLADLEPKVKNRRRHKKSTPASIQAKKENPLLKFDVFGRKKRKK